VYAIHVAFVDMSGQDWFLITASSPQFPISLFALEQSEVPLEQRP
jgi:hypothetical protein